MFTLLILAAFGILAITAIVLIEADRFGWATTTLVGSLVLSAVHTRWFGGPNIIGYLEHHWFHTLLCACFYVILGIAWSFLKWFSALRVFRDQFREAKLAFFKANGLEGLLDTAPIPDDKQEDFKKYMEHNYRYNYGRIASLSTLERPKATKNKSRITAWMCFWPFSFIGTVLNDPVRRLFNFLFNYFKALYQQLADRVFAKDVELK